MKKIWNDDMSVGQNIFGWLVGIVIVLGFAFGFMCLNSWLIMLVWNVTLPAIFGFTMLTFWQAFGLNLLVWLFLGGINKSISALFKED